MKKISTKDIVIMAMMLTILIVCSKIAFTLGSGVSLTLQTFAISIIYYVLKLKKSLLVLITYILMGLIGIPVFSSGGGLNYIFSLTFGYIIGFILFIITLHFLRNLHYSIHFTALIPLYLLGAVYMYLISNFYTNSNLSFITIIQISILPFIIKDIISVLLSYFVFKKLEKANIIEKEM